MALQVFKKHASFFIREKLNGARLALTGVSQIELLTEEATNEDPWGPETKTMAMVAEAAFELDEYERIVQVLHSRLERNQKTSWRQLYKTLVVLEYLLVRGPYSLANEFTNVMSRLEDLSQFQFIDQQGFDKGSMVRKKAERVLELLNDPKFWKEERSRAPKVSGGIEGFGSTMNATRSEAPEERFSVKNDSISFHNKGLAGNNNSRSETSEQRFSGKKNMSMQDRHSEHAILLNKDESKSYDRSISCPNDYRDMLLEDVTNALLGTESDVPLARLSTQKAKIS